MFIVILPLGLGALAGWLRAGRIRGLGDLKWRAPALVVAAAGMQLGLRWVTPAARVAVVLISYISVAVWVALNIRERPPGLRTGFVLIGLGWAMNMAAIAPNGGMPVSSVALDAVGAGSTYDVGHGHLYKHVPGRPSTPLPWLSDRLPVPAFRTIVSVGDIALAAGIAVLVSSAMVEAGPRRRMAVAPAG